MNLIEKLGIEKCRDLEVGDLVVSKDKNERALYEIKKIHHNKIDKWNYLYLKNTIYKNSGERGDYADKYTLATHDEIQANHCTDFGNHISPLTKVIER